MSIEKDFLAYECGYENGLDDVVGEQQEREEEEVKKTKWEDNITCPCCGYVYDCAGDVLPNNIQYDGQHYETYCHNCNSKFDIHLSVSYSFKSIEVKDN